MDIVYADERIVVAVKPAGVIATDTKRGGMPALLRQSLGTECIRTVHRLDAPVSGLMVCARSAYAAGELSRQIREGQFEKEYLAVVCGKVPENTGRLVDYLIKVNGMAVVKDAADVQVKNAADAQVKDAADVQVKDAADAQVKQAADPQAKKAVLTYTKKAETEKFTLLAVQIETGRFHQIRAQLSHAGFPILGDEKYGSEESKELSREKKIRFTALCAASLSFRHPVTGKTMAFTQAPQNPAFADFVIE